MIAFTLEMRSKLISIQRAIAWGGTLFSRCGNAAKSGLA
jgi:hypothetical protein